MTETFGERERGGAKMANVIYGLYAINLAVPGPFALIGVIIAYLQREETRGGWLDSHIRWQIRTFWLSIAWLVIGIVTIPIIIGFVILCLLWLWWALRIAIGWSRLSKAQPIVSPASWLF